MSYRIYDSMAHPMAVNQVRQVVTQALADNAYLFRNDLRGRGRLNSQDPRRSVEDSCGYPPWDRPIPVEDFYPMWRRNPIGRRVVNVWPNECWRVEPEVYEDEESEKDTKFEKAFKQVAQDVKGWSRHDSKGCSLWKLLHRADVLSGIGRYGVTLLGLNDLSPEDGAPLDLSQPVAGVEERHSMPGKPKAKDNKNGDGKDRMAEPPGVYNLTVNQDVIERERRQRKGVGRKLPYVRVFPEELAQIDTFETNWTSNRFGQPVTYNITFADPYLNPMGVGIPTHSVQVHWTRVVHVADNVESNEVHGMSRMEPVWDPLLDCRKIYGALGEGYWRNGLPKLFFETHPQLGGDVLVDKSALKTEAEQMMNDLQNWMLLRGMTANQKGSDVKDPEKFIDAVLEEICILLEIPTRVFRGSERGELASSQDKDGWNERVQGRRQVHVGPGVIAPFVDRLILCGVLPEPEREEGYLIAWPELGQQTETEKAETGAKRADALMKWKSSGLEENVTFDDYCKVFLRMDEDEIDEVVERAEKAAKEREAEEEAALAEYEKQAAELELEAGGAPLVPGQPSTQPTRPGQSPQPPRPGVAQPQPIVPGRRL